MAQEDFEIKCTFPVGPNEDKRMEMLNSYGILDTKNGEEFDRLTGLVRRVLDVPIALISLVDSKRQWFKANAGLEGCPETHRNLAFCAHAILPTAPDVFVVLDSHLDDRFKDNDLVTGPPYLRFYAGAPLRVTSPEGLVLNLGTVCALDQKPRKSFSIRDKQFLLDMSGIVVGELERFRQHNLKISEESQRYITCTSHELKTPLMAMKLATSAMREHFQQGINENKSQNRKAIDVVSKSKELNEMLEIVDQGELACEMMDQMISNAIDSARHRWTGESTKVNMGTVNLRKIVHLTERLSSRHHSEIVKFETEFGDAVPTLIRSDAHLLRRCLVNLVSNAFKYAPRTETSLNSPLCGGRPSYDSFWEKVGKEVPSAKKMPARVLIKVNVLMDQQKKNLLNRDDVRIDVVGEDEEEVSEVLKFLRIEVHDTGLGVPVELKGRLFRDSFVHADFSATDEEDSNLFTTRQGSGLGLYVSKICVQDLGGRIGYRSANGVTSPGDELEHKHLGLPDPDLGTVFWFDFPFSDEDTLPPQVCSRSNSQKIQESLLKFHEIGMEDNTATLDDIEDQDQRRTSDGWALEALGLNRDPSPEKPPPKLARVDVEPNPTPVVSDYLEPNPTPVVSDSVEPNPTPVVSEVETGVKARKRLLVVDDSVMIQKLLTKSLVKLGYEVDTALNGKEAIEKMMKESYLVVFMDFLMPILDGVSATAIFRDWEKVENQTLEEQGKARRDRQFIMGMSANAEESDKEAAFEAGINLFIAKPVVMKDLKSVISKVANETTTS